MAKSLAFEARICRFEAYRASQEYNRSMERQELQEAVDRLYERGDEESFEVMSRILDQARGITNIPESTQRSLGRSALREQE